MSNRKDIRVDSDNELIIVDGDFDIELSDQQHIKDILESGQGNWKQNANVGVYIGNMLNGPFGLQEERFIRQQLANDGYSSVQLVMKEGKINIRI